jgi:hypothetical protein
MVNHNMFGVLFKLILIHYNYLCETHILTYKY